MQFLSMLQLTPFLPTNPPTQTIFPNPGLFFFSGDTNLYVWTGSRFFHSTAQAFTAVTTEAVSIGLVNVTAAGVRGANASVAGRRVSGYVTQAAALGTNALVFTSGIITGLSGITAGTPYFLGAVNGSIVATPPNTAGSTVEFIGTGVNATSITYQYNFRCIRS
jgi:hypothetical protein